MRTSRSVRRDFRGHADIRREYAQGQIGLRCHRTQSTPSTSHGRPSSLLQLLLTAVHPQRLCTGRRHLSGPDCLEMDRGDVQPRRGEHLILPRRTAAVVIHSRITTAGAGNGECGQTGKERGLGERDFWPRAKSTFLVPVDLCCILLLSQRCSTGLLAFAPHQHTHESTTALFVALTPKCRRVHSHKLHPRLNILKHASYISTFRNDASLHCTQSNSQYWLLLLPMQFAVPVPSGFRAHEVYVRCMQAV